MADTETQLPAKHPGGRPTKYKPEFVQAIVQNGRKGMTVAEMADEFDVSIQSLYEWSGVYPEFSEAFSRAQEAAEACWARKIRDGLEKAPSEFQGAANLKYMAQRFKGWSEKAHVDTREVDPADEAETPDLRGEARKAAFLLSKAAIDAK
jgi:transposase